MLNSLAEAHDAFLLDKIFNPLRRFIDHTLGLPTIYVADAFHTAGILLIAMAMNTLLAGVPTLVTSLLIAAMIATLAYLFAYQGRSRYTEATSRSPNPYRTNGGYRIFLQVWYTGLMLFIAPGADFNLPLIACIWSGLFIGVVIPEYIKSTDAPPPPNQTVPQGA